MGKFDAIKNDEGTVVLARTEGKLNGLDVLHEAWAWEKIRAESFVFLEEDVREMSDEAVLCMVKSSPAVEKDSKTTLNRSESGFVFVSFNFHAMD